MSYLSLLLGTGTPARADLNSDLAFMLSAGQTASGMAINPSTALKISTVWACVKLISETIASLPAIVYQRDANGDKTRATNHPLYDLLHTQPNQGQTAFEFFEMMTGHALMRGNAYALIQAGPRGFADQLIPLHPDTVTPEKIAGTNKLRYRVAGYTQPFNDDQILHLRGRSDDGLIGLDPVSYARESFGLTMAGEKYGAKFFGNNSIPGGILKTAGKLKPDTAKRLKGDWESAHQGGNNQRVAVLEEGLEWQAMGIDPRNAQFLELRQFQAEDVCRWYGVPPHMVGLTAKVTSWGSGIEQLGIGYVTYTLVPWLTRWAQAISRDLILAPQTYFVEFLVAGLLRGDLKSRYDAYAIAIDKGWYNVNEVRKLENENSIGPDGDVYRTPAAAAQPGPMAQSFDNGYQNSAHYAALLREAAGRVVRKEVAALTRAAKKGDFMQAAREFYHDHAEFVAATLQIKKDQAAAYVAGQLTELEACGPEAITDWDTRKVETLLEVING